MTEGLQAEKISPKEENAGNVSTDRYVRVRTDYYKIVEKPMTDGTRVQQLIKWKYAFIKADHGREYAEEVPCYDDFITFPDNINPQQVVDGKFWNLYHPMKFKPEPGDFPNIDKLMEHIFGEQKELGYDYLQQLYTNPQQKLPIIVLVSRERNTGKSTFMHFLHLWFGDNVTFNTNEDFGSQFNADWAGMLLICVDEALLSKREYSERIKDLGTARFYKIEAKGKDKVQQKLSCKREQKQTCLHFAECSQQCSFGTILRGKEYKKMFYRPVDTQLERERPSPFADIRVTPLTSSYFLDYCTKRCIDPEVARAECRQVDYQLYGRMNSAIGFENDKGGWELRNPSTKICTCKAISTRRKQDGNMTVCAFKASSTISPSSH